MSDEEAEKLYEEINTSPCIQGVETTRKER